MGGTNTFHNRYENDSIMGGFKRRERRVSRNIERME